MPSTDMLTALVQRLVRTIGLSATQDLISEVPGLQIDQSGQVVVYDRSQALSTARILIELYDALTAQNQDEREFGRSPVGSSDGFVPGEGPELNSQLARLMMVDDHALVRDGLANLIGGQPDFKVVGEAGSMREAISLARECQPDVILMDFTLPDGTGDEATRLILSHQPQLKIVFLTVHDDDERLFAAIAAGAVGYLLKSVRSTDLLSRLRAVMRGEVALSPSLGRRIFAKLARQQPIHPVESPKAAELSERENEILAMIVQGHTNRQIAGKLSLSVRTVEYHRANLMDKLGASTRADLVHYAQHHGLLD